MARESGRSGERRGEWGTHTGRDSYTERAESKRRGGGGYDAGPGRELLPVAKDLDRPASPCGTYGRTGERRGGIDEGIHRIQDQDRRGR